MNRTGCLVAAIAAFVVFLALLLLFLHSVDSAMQAEAAFLHMAWL